MTGKKRIILFLFLVVLFLIAAPISVLYSLGWRFDWQTKKVFQPGVFYFKVWPKSVEVFLDGKLKKKTDFFFGSALIANLFPRKYEVEIKKERFHSWKKTLEIKEREVTEAKNIILVPESPKFKILSNEVENFFFSPDGKKIIIKEKTKDGWALKLFEIEKNLKSHLLKEKDISKEEVQLINLSFSPDSKTILLEVGLKEKLEYYLLEIDKVPIVLTSLGFLEWPEQAFLASPLEVKNVITLTVSDKDIYYLDNSGFLFKNQEKLNIIPFEVKRETKHKITASNSYILLEQDGVLYIFDEDKKSFQKIFEPAKGLKFSPDSKKLVYFNNYEIWILFLEKITEIPKKEAGDKVFLTRFSEKIDNVFWFTNHYLVFNTGNKIKIAEIDDRDRINIVDLAEFKSPEIFWANKKLYVLSEGNLYVPEELIP